MQGVAINFLFLTKMINFVQYFYSCSNLSVFFHFSEQQDID